MKWTVLAVGKLKEAYFQAACQEYEKRIRRHVTLEIVEVKSETALVAAVAERKRPGTELWALAILGKPLSTEVLAQMLGERMAHSHGTREICFLIGGAEGLSPATLAECQLKWSLGPLTLAHRLARLVVLEQLYRVLTILRGEPYHK